MRSKELAKVISQECIGTGVYSMWIETKAADTAVAGQFISVYCNDKTKLLPRPIRNLSANSTPRASSSTARFWPIWQ
jgi:hypothetical protein